MNLPTPRVLVFEDNATRADLYAHWLDQYDVEVALTRHQAAEAIDGSAAVAILDEEFADGSAEKVFEVLRSRNPAVQVVTTARNREKVVPSLDVDTHLAKPVFEVDLTETVDRMARRAMYTRSLAEYFRLTVELTNAEVGEAEGKGPENVDEIRERVEELKKRLSQLVRSMDGNDVKAVLHDLTRRAEPGSQKAEKRDSKYVPPKCPSCGTRWNEEDDAAGPIRLGSFVWRCGDCGHVQMHGDPKRGNLAPFL